MPCWDVRKEFTLSESHIISFWFGNLKKESKNGGCRRQCQHGRGKLHGIFYQNLTDLYIIYTHSRQEQDERVARGERGDDSK